MDTAVKVSTNKEPLQIEGPTTEKAVLPDRCTGKRDKDSRNSLGVNPRGLGSRPPDFGMEVILGIL